MSSEDRNEGRLSGVAHPTPALLRKLGRMYGPAPVPDLPRVLDDLVAVDALAGLLDRAMAAHTTKDGRLDLRDVAAFVLKEIKENQR
jgi:hypothetical protein